MLIGRFHLALRFFVSVLDVFTAFRLSNVVRHFLWVCCATGGVSASKWSWFVSGVVGRDVEILRGFSKVGNLEEHIFPSLGSLDETRKLLTVFR
jgi:hypothetical protein